MISHFEEKLNKPLHWFVCQLHGIELVLRHLFEHFDGKKTGPVSFSGLISKLLVTCQDQPVVQFNPVSLEDSLSEIDTKTLSKDQHYLLEMARSVNDGTVSVDLANKNPGPMSHSRWLTTANRLLRLYVASRKSSKKHQQLVELKIKVYVPIWFAIKKNPECYNGLEHV